MRVSVKEMGGLFNEREALHAIGWPVAPDYEIRHGIIYPKDSRQADWYAPLAEPGLFLGFARLGAHGEPSQDRILKWVRKHGLLRRANYEDNPRLLTKSTQIDVGNELVEAWS